MDVSVVVPAYNAARYLPACLDALVGQELPRDHYEVIVVDNNSRDRSADIIRGYPEVCLLAEPKQGSYAARNRGLRQAQGAVIAFTDADCVPTPDWLARIVAGMADAEVGILVGTRSAAGPSRMASLLAAYADERHRYIVSQGDPSLYYGHTNNLAVQRDLFSALGPFVEGPRGSDAIFVHQAVKHFGTNLVRFAPELSVRHLELDGMLVSYRKAFLYGLSRRRYRRMAPVRGFTAREKARVLRQTVENRAGTPLDSVLLTVLLAGASICHALGYAVGDVVPRPVAEW